MTWIQRYRLRLYIRNSAWLFPVLGMLTALALGRAIDPIEAAFGWTTTYPPAVAQTVLITLASSIFTCIVFVCSTMLLALQLASAQLTPRIIAFVFRDPITKFALTLFVFTFTFSVAAVVRINASMPLLTARLAVYSSIASLIAFFYLTDHIGRSLRPSHVLRTVALQGRKVIESVYPRELGKSHEMPHEPARLIDGKPTAIIPVPMDGVVLACDIPGCVSLAWQSNCVVEMVPRVGDYVAAGDPLFRIFGDGGSPSAPALQQMIAIGAERTIEQDPSFAFRIIVDIACKALSPAINDPTTAVQAIDQLQHLLRNVGLRCLDDERVRDAQNRLRLIYRTPSWGDFVHLAVTEIRHFGSESIQVARRLRAMLEDLSQSLPEERQPLLRQELKLLQRSASRFFPEPEDRALASVSDAQGVGGATGHDDGVLADGNRR